MIDSPAPLDPAERFQGEDRKIIDGVRIKLDRYREACRPKFQAFVRNHRLYTADPRINDPRDRVKEKWRSWVTVPKVHTNVNTASAIVSDVITSSDPMVKAMRVHDSKQEIATYGENVLAYMYDQNQFRTRILPEVTKNLEIQGTVIVKTDFVDHSREGMLTTTQEDVEGWWSKVFEVEQLTSKAPDLEADPAAFQVWMEQAETAGHPIPPYPTPTGRQVIKGYRGPWYTIPSIWNVFMDPFQPEIQRQEMIVEIVMQPRSYLDARLKAQEASGMSGIDPAAVEWGRTHGIASTVDKFNEFQRAYFDYLDLDSGQFNLRNTDEPWDVFYEVYMPNNPEHKYLSILNESTIVNTDRSVSPYPFGDAPYIVIKRIPMTGSAYGLSPIQAIERLVYEASSTRSKRMDLVNLAANPSFQVLSSAYAGLSKTMRQYNSGTFYSVPVPNSIKQIKIEVPSVLFTENAETLRDIDEAWGIGENLRGQQATTGRVPATESQARQTQATLPLIGVARNIEDAFAQTHPWCFQMLREYCSEEELIGMGGSGGGELMRVDKSKLSELMAMSLRFTGATTTRNRDQQATMLANAIRTYSTVIQPHELRKIAVVALRQIGINGVDELLDQEVTDAMEQQAMQQIQMMQQGMMPGAPMGAPGGMGGGMPGQGAPAPGGGGASGGPPPGIAPGTPVPPQ